MITRSLTSILFLMTFLLQASAWAATYSTDQFVYHIIKKADWAAAKNTSAYAPSSLKEKGTIPASKGSQLLHVANKYFKGKTDLEVLVIDTKKVGAEIAYNEKGSPRIKGALEVNAVVESLAFAPGADGTFTLPAKMKY